MRQELLQMIGGLRRRKRICTRGSREDSDGSFSVEKLIYESLPGVYVTALVYSPDDHSTKHPAVLVPAATRPMERFTIRD